MSGNAASKLPDPGCEPYALYAIRFAHHVSRRSLTFLGGDADDGPMPFDYFVWLAVGSERRVLIDTGFKQSTAQRRKRGWMHCPSKAIEQLGVTADQVTDVVVTHMHFDHAGNLDKFPNAAFHIQDREMAFATGRHMCNPHPTYAGSLESEDVIDMVRHIFSRRTRFHKGDDDLAPGIRLLQVPGHTPGMQMVAVWTQRGWVLVISDASHFYEHMNTGRPFFMYCDLADVFASYRRIRDVAPSLDHIIPGHDPLVREQYPAPSPELDGIAVRLDVAPKFSALRETDAY